MSDDFLTETHDLAHRALPLWDLPAGAALRLINVSENITYLVEAPGWRSVLRVHRPGYHSARAIHSELSWMTALSAEGGVEAPAPVPGRDGAPLQSVRGRHLVMFHFIDGAAPDESHDLTGSFHQLGGIAARCHLHALRWTRPAQFERLTWDAEAVFGSAPTWGNWRAAPNLTPDAAAVLERVESTVRQRLHQFGKSRARYGLIHADMRLANLILTDTGPRLIDFDDCGFGWLLYDFAAAISFIEDHPRIPALKAAWLAGYRTVRALSAADEAEMDTLIMLRRMALLAWIGSHMEATEPQALAPDFARATAELGERYLTRFE